MNNKITLILLLLTGWTPMIWGQEIVQDSLQIRDSLNTQSIMFVKSQKSHNIVAPKIYSYDRLGIFCKLDVILERKNKLNIHFRLPSQ